MTLEKAKNLCSMYKEQYDNLVSKYGLGVRPSWVSSDLDRLGANIRYYKGVIEKLENENV